MSPRLLETAALAVAVALTAAGCGSKAAERGATAQGGVQVTSGGTAPSAPAPPDPLQLLPRDAFAVVDVDLDRLRASAYYQEALRWYLSQSSIDADRRDLVHRVLDATHHAVIGALRPAAPGRDPEWVVVTQGRYEPGQLRRIMTIGHNAAKVGKSGGRPVFVSGDIQAVELPGPTWLFTEGPRARASLDRSGDAAPDSSPLDRPALRAVADRVGFGRAALTAVAEVPPELRSEVGDGRWFARETGQALRTAGLRLAFEQGADVRLVVGTADGPSAVVLARRVEELLQWAEGNMFIAMFGLRPLLEATQVRADGSPNVVLHLHVDDAQVRSLIGRLESLGSRAIEAQSARAHAGAAAAEGTAP